MLISSWNFTEKVWKLKMCWGVFFPVCGPACVGCGHSLPLPGNGDIEVHCFDSRWATHPNCPHKTLDVKRSSQASFKPSTSTQRIQRGSKGCPIRGVGG